MNGRHQYDASEPSFEPVRCRAAVNTTASAGPYYPSPTTETSSFLQSAVVHNTGQFGVDASAHYDLARYPNLQDTSTSSSLQRSRSQSQSVSTGPSTYTPLSLESTVSPTIGLPPDTLRQRLYQISLRGEPTEISYDKAFEDFEKYSLPSGEDDGQPLSTFALHHAVSPTIAGYNALEHAWPSHHVPNNIISSYNYPYPCPLPSSTVQVPVKAITSAATMDMSVTPYLEHQPQPFSGTARQVRPKLAPAVSSNGAGTLSAFSEAVPAARHPNVPGRRGRNVAASTPHSRKAPERRTCEICKTDGQKKKYEFRGQHELDRHNNKQHSQGNRRWICLDPTPDQRHSWCKNCRIGKAYAINYNAAEHIRRSHLYADGSERPGKRARGALRGSRKNDHKKDDKESRSGRMPSIQDLIKGGWMKLVLLPNSPDTDDDDLDEDYDQQTHDFEYTSQPFPVVCYRKSEPNSGSSTVRQGTEEDHPSPPRFSSAEMNWHFTNTNTFSPNNEYRIHGSPDGNFSHYFYPTYNTGNEQQQQSLRPFNPSGPSSVSVPRSQLSSPDLACFRDLSMSQN